MKSLLFLASLVGVLVLVSGKEKAEHVKESHYTEDGEHNDAYDHQSILGSKEEEEEFANLSPAEAKKRLALMFEKMDSNQDTFVSKDEIVAWILRSYIQMDVDEAKTSVEEYDTNKDGKVTWSEYLNKLQGDAPESSDSEEMKETIEADKLKFDAADVDKDGALSLNEYAAFMYPYDFKHMHHVEIEMTLRQMDNDKDGTINFNEFTGEVPTTDEKDQLANKENFAEFDKDKDGKLDKKEMEAWIVPSNDESAIDEAGHLIDETDTDSDGKLSKEEVLAKHDLWVGSSATAYGKGLHDEL